VGNITHYLVDVFEISKSRCPFLKVEGIMDICEHRDAETKPLIFCVVARDGMPSKVWENLGVSEKWAIGEDIGFQSRVNAILLLDLCFGENLMVNSNDFIKFIRLNIS